jgi:hypothetical protein
MSLRFTRTLRTASGSTGGAFVRLDRVGHWSYRLWQPRSLGERSLSRHFFAGHLIAGTARRVEFRNETLTFRR